MHESVGQFFDGLTSDYTAAIERCFPRYREMLWALLDYLPADRPVRSVLELGSGTGNLSVILRDAFPHAALTLVDVSCDSLESCRERFATTDNVRFEHQDFRHLMYAEGTFDLIVSSIAVHHLTAPEKRELFSNAYTWLTASGIFSVADQFAGATDDLSNRHLQNWKRLSTQAGSDDDEWQMWMQHMADHDHHDTLVDQIMWLQECGFRVVDCPWRYLLWSVVQARK